MRRHRYLLAAVMLVVFGRGAEECEARQAQQVEAAEGVYLLIRSDDAGMSHAVNMATKKLLEADIPVSVSIMFPCPWYQEIVDILRDYPDVSVGIHLTLNSEWRHYRWGPIVGREAAPSLVDEDGYFFHSSAALYENDPDLTEVERELRAQIERALATGLNIDYVDSHMATTSRDADMRAIVDRLGSEYDLGVSGSFGEQGQMPQYMAEPGAKLDTLVAMVERLEPGTHLLVTHPGLDTPELEALVEMNAAQPLENMSVHRQAELDAVTADAFAEALARHGVTPITYREHRAMRRKTP